MNQFFKSKPFKRAFKLTVFSFLVIFILGAAVGLWYGGPSTPLDMEDPPKCCVLTLDTSVSINQIVRAVNYKPLWIGVEDVSVTVKAADKDGVLSEIECAKLFSYDEESETFTATGIGKGTFTFTSNVDEAVSFTVPFEVGYKSAQTKAILESEYAELVEDNVLTSEEIASITSITIRGTDVDAADLALFPALKSLLLSCENGIPAMHNLKSGWEYFVPAQKYSSVIRSKNWLPYEKHIFPEVNKGNDTFEVVFDSVGGEFLPNDDLKKISYNEDFYVYLVEGGSELNLARLTPMKKGYTFVEWRTYGDTVAGIESDKQPVKEVLSENLRLKAVWMENSYTVRFDLNGGTGTVASGTLKYTEQYTPYIVTLRREGYDFLGWSTTANGSVLFDPDDKLVSLTDKNNDVVTLYAVWRADVYNVEFYDGVTLLDSKRNIGYFDTFKIIPFSPPSVTGMTFLGWSLDPTATVPSYSSGKELSGLTETYGGTVRFYTVWDVNRYTVTYNANGGKGAPSAQTAKYNEVGYVPTQEPTRYGYTFKGWAESFLSHIVSYMAGDPYINLCSKNNDTYSLYAVWEPDTFKIRFNATGATSGTAVTKEVAYGSAFLVEISEFNKTGYYIEGWVTKSGSTKVEYLAEGFTPAEVEKFYEEALKDNNRCIDLYPVWKEITYTISLDPNEGNLSGNRSYNLKYTQRLTLPTPTKDYYTFDGWECEYNQETYGKGQSITGSNFKNLKNDHEIKLVAKWKLAKYDITYDLAGGKGTTSSKTGVSVSSSVTLPNAPTKDGYTFEGWMCSVDGNVYSAGTSKSNWANSTEKSVTFTAQWRKNP